MKPYIYGVKDGVHVFDLIKTKENLEIALEVLAKYTKEGKVILFVGTKKQAKEKTKEVAVATNSPFITERWLGGTITNFAQITKSIRKLKELKENMASGLFNTYTKKERLLINREIEKLEKTIGGLATMSKLPDLIVIVDTHKEKAAVLESFKTQIPTIGIVDSNANPDLVTYPIPMNDDAGKAVSYVLDLFKDAILAKPAKPAKAKKAKKSTK
jgi:small subunit ribosomal protein S2